jgi:hypothetical protein
MVQQLNSALLRVDRSMMRLVRRMFERPARKIKTSQWNDVITRL